MAEQDGFVTWWCLSRFEDFMKEAKQPYSLSTKWSLQKGLQEVSEEHNQQLFYKWISKDYTSFYDDSFHYPRQEGSIIESKVFTKSETLCSEGLHVFPCENICILSPMKRHSARLALCQLPLTCEDGTPNLVVGGKDVSWGDKFRAKALRILKYYEFDFQEEKQKLPDVLDKKSFIGESLDRTKRIIELGNRSLAQYIKVNDGFWTGPPSHRVRNSSNGARLPRNERHVISCWMDFWHRQNDTYFCFIESTVRDLCALLGSETLKVVASREGWKQEFFLMMLDHLLAGWEKEIPLSVKEDCV